MICSAETEVLQIIKVAKKSKHLASSLKHFYLAQRQIIFTALMKIFAQVN